MDVNLTHNSDFRLRGFDHLLDYRMCLFVFFLFTYVLTLSGNMVIVLVVRCHIHLHTPMYYFIINLSILEMWYISTTVPKLLELLVTNNNIISFHWCFAQLYMFHGLGMTECALLAIMAFDRWVAICNPLRYTTLMNETMCKQLASLCWAYGFLAAIVPMMTTLKLPLCGLRDINHYFCDLAPLASLSCVDTSFNDIINSCVIGFATMFNLAIISLMYLNIIFSVVRLRSNTGRKKAFSTCSSHITVVALFYSTAFTIYGIPKHAQAADYQKIVALVYAMFTPLLNPVIYSLRNKEVKEALGRSIKRVMGKIRNGKLL